MAVLKDVLRNFTFANQLTFLRLIAIPFFIICVLTNRPGIALVLFVGAAVTDMFDGLIARFLKQTTALGAFLDPAADKLLLTAGFICLTIPDHPKALPAYEAPNHLPIQLTILTISRDTFIVITAITLYLVTPVRRFPPTLLGKITTCAEMVTIAGYLFFNARVEDSVFLDIAAWATLTLVVASGFHYIYRCSRMIREAQQSAGETPAS
jgi:CDP-diacylglycerol--glycerol-3-phosphate 3-phosphatidyltransferase